MRHAQVARHAAPRQKPGQDRVEALTIMNDDKPCLEFFMIKPCHKDENLAHGSRGLRRINLIQFKPFMI
jgi:hypothetical protein